MPRKLPKTRTIADVWRAIADENIASLPQVAPGGNDFNDRVEIENITLETGLCRMLYRLKDAGAITPAECEEMVGQLDAMFYDPSGKSGSDYAYLWPPQFDQDNFPDIDLRGVRYTAAGLLALYADGEIAL